MTSRSSYQDASDDASRRAGRTRRIERSPCRRPQSRRPHSPAVASRCAKPADWPSRRNFRCLGRRGTGPVNAILQRRLILPTLDNQTAALSGHHIRVERALPPTANPSPTPKVAGMVICHISVSSRTRLERDDVADLRAELVQLQHQESAQAAGHHDRHRCQDRQPMPTRDVPLGVPRGCGWVLVGWSHGA